MTQDHDEPVGREDGGAGRDHYADHLDRFGDALRAATVRGAPRPVARRPLVVTAGLAVAAGAAVVIAVAASPGGGPVDPLGEARAALDVRGELVHYRVRESFGPVAGRGVDIHAGRAPTAPGTGGTACPRRGTVEVWQAVDPVRWRVVEPADPRGPGCTATADADGLIRGPQEYAFANDTRSRYLVERDALSVVSAYEPGGSASRIPVGTEARLGREEPLELLRRLLREGRLRDRGERTLGGRHVRMLAGTRTVTRRFGRRAADVVRVPETVVYAVDAETFAPVRAVRTSVRPELRRRPRGGASPLRVTRLRTYASQIDFVAYDRRPLDAEARRLLVIRPSRPLRTVTRTTQEELRAKIREQTRKDRREAARRRAAASCTDVACAKSPVPPLNGKASQGPADGSAPSAAAPAAPVLTPIAGSGR